MPDQQHCCHPLVDEMNQLDKCVGGCQIHTFFEIDRRTDRCGGKCFASAAGARAQHTVDGWNVRSQPSANRCRVASPLWCQWSVDVGGADRIARFAVPHEDCGVNWLIGHKNEVTPNTSDKILRFAGPVGIDSDTVVFVSTQSSVIVVGAGPTGLMLAGDLAAAGIATTIVDRRAHGSEHTKAFAVHARTLEEFDMRGIADELIRRGQRVDKLRVSGSITIDFGTLPCNYPYILVVPQQVTEQVPERRARRLGVQFLRGVAVTGLRPDDDGVTLSLDNGETQRAAYVVGADGHHSTVRELLGLPFPGKTVVKSVMMADVKLTDQLPRAIATNFGSGLFAFVAPFGDGYHRVICWDHKHQGDESDPVDLDRLKAIMTSVHGTDFGMHEPRWMTRFHSDERQVPRYRVGRVFLAGDAAHEHSPAGGQGMNVGLQDAANLGWKLAQTLNGGADLLDTYHEERYPVGSAAIASSGALLRAAQFGTGPVGAVRDLVAGTVLRLGPVSRRLQFALSGLGVSYPAPHGAHRCVGKRVDDVALDGPTRSLYQELCLRHFVLIGDDTAVEGWSDRVETVHAVYPRMPVELIRPDGYVAWAAEPDTRYRESLQRALAGWCGPRAAGVTRESGSVA
jgi:2-polyprenyl-6-methoxyphenol hydroxylase-like FAD-dependent oxidoreductase